MARWSPVSILIKTLAIQDPGTMIISGDYVFVKRDGLWWDTKIDYQNYNASEMAERLIWWETMWGSTYTLY